MKTISDRECVPPYQNINGSMNIYIVIEKQFGGIMSAWTRYEQAARVAERLNKDEVYQRMTRTGGFRVDTLNVDDFTALHSHDSELKNTV